jgi:hypothetical protein
MGCHHAKRFFHLVLKWHKSRFENAMMDANSAEESAGK